MTDYDDLLTRAAAVSDLPALEPYVDPILYGTSEEIADEIDYQLSLSPGLPAGVALVPIQLETVADPAAGVVTTDGGASPDPESWRMVGEPEVIRDDAGDITEVNINVEPVYPADTPPPATRSPSAHGAAILSPSPLVRDKAAEFLNSGLPDLPPPIGDAS